MTEKESLDLIQTYADMLRNKLVSHITYYQIKRPRLVSKVNEIIDMIELLEDKQKEED